MGSWVGTQRAEYKKMKAGEATLMTHAKASQLEGVVVDGFAWTVRGSKVPWEVRFDELRAYRASFGDCDVPAKFNANRRLGTWTQVQRAQYQLFMRGEPAYITAERIELLEDQGFKWDLPQPKTQWEKKFHELRQFKAEFGTCRVPLGYARNQRLGSWVAGQRGEYELVLQGRTSRISHDQFVRLRALGFEE